MKPEIQFSIGDVSDLLANPYVGLGMHRDTGPSTLSSVDKRRWRRTWWIVVQYDVMVSLSYGRPQAM